MAVVYITYLNIPSHCIRTLHVTWIIQMQMFTFSSYSRVNVTYVHVRAKGSRIWLVCERHVVQQVVLAVRSQADRAGKRRLLHVVDDAVREVARLAARKSSCQTQNLKLLSWLQGKEDVKTPNEKLPGWLPRKTAVKQIIFKLTDWLQRKEAYKCRKWKWPTGCKDRKLSKTKREVDRLAARKNCCQTQNVKQLPGWLPRKEAAKHRTWSWPTGCKEKKLSNTERETVARLAS